MLSSREKFFDTPLFFPESVTYLSSGLWFNPRQKQRFPVPATCDFLQWIASTSYPTASSSRRVVLMRDLDMRFDARAEPIYKCLLHTSRIGTEDRTEPSPVATERGRAVAPSKKQTIPLPVRQTGSYRDIVFPFPRSESRFVRSRDPPPLCVQTCFRLFLLVVTVIFEARRLHRMTGNQCLGRTLQPLALGALDGDERSILVSFKRR